MTDGGTKQIRGILSNAWKPANPELDSRNQIHYADWTMQSFTGLSRARRTLQNSPEAYRPAHHVPLESGMLLTAFNTVSKGKILWDGVVNLEYGRAKQEGFRKQQAIFGMWVHGFQNDLKPEEWASMFFTNLPARLEKNDGTIAYGALDTFFETGTEGVIWSLHEYGKAGYDGLNCLKNGDRLTVYKSVSDGGIAWQGTLDFEETGKIEYDADTFTHFKRMPKHLSPDEWVRMHWENRPVLVTPKP